MRLRQVHLDFHTSEKIADVGKEFDKKQFQKALIDGHVDSITVFSKCHHGWSYHPTKANEMHPTLTFDLLKAQIEAAHEIGVKTPVYISAGLDEKHAVRHPEHLSKRVKDGEIIDQDFTRPRFHHLCLNSGYMDYLLAQIEETCGNYDLDGLFLDIVSPSSACCACDTCLAMMKERGIDPFDADAYKAFGEETYVRYTKRVRETVDRVKPGLKIFHNGGNTPRGKRYLERLNSHIEIESLPTGGWGYDNLPMTARSVQSHGMEYLGMTGKFHKGWGEFGGYKHPNALRYEAALTVANGGACSVGDQLHPLGAMDDATYRLIGAAYAEVEEKEPWITDVTAEADVAFYSYEAYLARHPEERSLDADYKYTDTGALRILLEGHYLFDVVDGENDLSSYKLVILPDGVQIDETLKKQLDPFLKNGGKLLASGASGTLNGAFAYDFGATYLGKREIAPVYLIPENIPAVDRAGYVIYAPADRVSVTDGEVIASLHEAYFNRTVEHFCSHRHAPEKPTDTEAGIVLGRDGAYCTARLFREYAKDGCLIAKKLVHAMIERLIGDVKRVSVSGFMPSGIVTLMHQEAKNRSVLHLVYAEKTARGESKIEVIEETPTLYGVEVTLRPEGRRVCGVTLEPSGTAIAFTENRDGSVSFRVPEIYIHAMIAVQYA